MARGRMLNKTVCASKKFDDLPDDTCRLLATWTISNLDCRGVFYCDPAMVRSYVFPRRMDVTLEDIERHLLAMESVGLIEIFYAKGDVWQCWPGFPENQIGLRAERETKDFPDPATGIRKQSGISLEDFRNESGMNPATIRDDARTPDCNADCSGNESRISEEKRSEVQEKRSEVEVKAPPQLQNAFTVYERAAGTLSPLASDAIKEMTKDFEAHRLTLSAGVPGSDLTGDEWVQNAILVAVDAGATRFGPKYLRKILDRWRAEGYKSAWKGNGSAGGKSTLEQNFDTIQKWAEGDGA